MKVLDRLAEYLSRHFSHLSERFYQKQIVVPAEAQLDVAVEVDGEHYGFAWRHPNGGHSCLAAYNIGPSGEALKQEILNLEKEK